MVSVIRAPTRDMKSVESNLQQKLSIVAHSVDKYFTDPEVNFECFRATVCTNSEENFIIELVQSLQENYTNVTKSWTALNLNNFALIIATDLKLVNILPGIMSHSRLYPCKCSYAVKKTL